MADAPTAADIEARRDALVERLFGAAVAAWDVFAVYLGDRLGLYRALAERGPSTSVEVAQALDLCERYVREWLEQQATTGILEVDLGTGRYALPPGHDEALVDDSSLDCIVPIGQLLAGCLKPLDAVAAAFRSEHGIPYAEYGTDLHEDQARFTRPMLDRLLTAEWLPAVADTHAGLLADPPARVADVACGEGHSTLAIARGYPRVSVDGIDIDAASIAAARRHLEGTGLEERVAFHLRDPADEEMAGSYDLIYLHEALHDMSYPVRLLSACRRLLADGGSMVVADERVPTNSLRPATRSSGSITGAASFTAYRSAWSATAPRGRARSCGRKPCAATPRRGVRRLRAAPDRKRLLPLLPPDALT